MKYNCPMCQSEMVTSQGDSMHPGNPNYGVTLFCPSHACPAQEVMGHGDNEEKAFKVIQQKFMGGR